jgi:outer membrane protein W
MIFKIKVYLTVVVICFCGGIFSSASAQSNSFGLKFGLNRSSFAGELPLLTEIEESYNFKTGYNLGIVLIYKLSNAFALSPEVNYVIKGSKYQNVSDTEFLQKDIQLNYLEIPVLVRFYFFNGGSFRPNIFAGPSLSIFISGAEDRHWMSLSSPVFEDPIEYDIKDFDVSDKYRSTEIGVVSGFGFQYPLKGDILLNMDFRFAYGLTDIKKDLLLDNQMSFSLDMAVMFPF